MFAMGEFITLSEAGRRAKVSRGTIHTWLKRGKLTPQVRQVDGRWFVDADELAEKTKPKPPARDS